jgi:hypothetical protein
VTNETIGSSVDGRTDAVTDLLPDASMARTFFLEVRRELERSPVAKPGLDWNPTSLIRVCIVVQQQFQQFQFPFTEIFRKVCITVLIRLEHE